MKIRRPKTIVFCSSVTFYKNLFPIKKELEKMGFRVKLPKTAYIMKRTDNFDEDFWRTWKKNPKDYYKKRALMDGHFRKILEGDAILVANYEKNGVKGYIGGNVFMEITIAYFLKKPVFILNDIGDEFPIREELNAISATFLKGNLLDISKHRI